MSSSQTPPHEVELTRVTAFHLRACLRNDQPLVILEDGKPAGYFMPYDGKNLKYDIPPRRGNG